MAVLSALCIKDKSDSNRIFHFLSPSTLRGFRGEVKILKQTIIFNLPDNPEWCLLFCKPFNDIAQLLILNFYVFLVQRISSV